MKHNKILQEIILLILLISSLTLSGCSTREPKIVYGVFFDTLIEIKSYDNTPDEIMQGALDLCQKYELTFSATNELSELYQLNHRNMMSGYIKQGNYHATISKELYEAIQEGLHVGYDTNGALNITLGNIIEQWNFTPDNTTLPDYELISRKLQSCKIEDIVLGSDYTIDLLNPELTINLGAIAKGYIADRLKEYFISNGSTDILISLGGNTLCIGNNHGKKYKIGIQKPFADKNDIPISIESIANSSMVTSGVYERYFYVDDKLYHHILNPLTGQPVNNNLLSVTIITDSSVEADALSTAIFVMGLEDGSEYIKSRENISAIFVTDEYKVININ